MSTDSESATAARVGERLRAVVWGTADPRLRATWRVLLAMPLLWTLTGGVLAGNVQSSIGVIPDGGATGAGVAQSVLHGGFFLLVLVAWARVVDRRRLSEYGVSTSVEWVRDFLVGLLAVLVGFGVWNGLTSVLGGTTVAVSPSVPKGSVLVGLVLPFVALVLHAAVQQVVFFNVILGNAVEGFRSRGVGAVQAALGAILVAILLFVAMHGELTALRVLDLAVAGAVFALLYLHTGELALGIGAHFGALYGGIVLSTLLQVTGSPSGVLGVLDGYGFPKMAVAYAVLVAWLTWRQGELSIRTDSTRWTGG